MTTAATGLRIKSTGRNSEWLGNCEVCGKYCPSVYKQQRKHQKGWHIELRGHLQCLQVGEFATAPVEHDHTAR